MIGVLLDDRAQAPVVRKLQGITLQMKLNGGTTTGLFDRLHAELCIPGTLPANAFNSRRAGPAGSHHNPVCNDKGRIETYPELTDQLRILLLVAAELLHKLRSTGFSDSPEVINDLITRHADTVIADRDGLGVLVKADADLQIGVPFVKITVRHRLKAHPARRIRRSGGQLPQQDRKMRILRMKHKMQ